MRKKFLTFALSAAMVATTVLAPVSSVSAEETTKDYISTTKWNAPTHPEGVSSKVITTAGHRAAQTLVEILGLNNTACQNMAGNPDGVTDGSEDQADPHDNIPSNPKGLYINSQVAAQNCKMLGVFGSDLNSNPDPYYYNYFYNCYAETTDYSQVDNEIYCIDGKLSPNEADTKPVTALGNVSCSVARQPDILIGASASGSYTGQTYDEYIKALRTGSVKTNTDETVDVTGDYSSYNPLIFKYLYTSVYEEGESLQRLATLMNNIDNEAGSVDTTEKNTHKGSVGRYGDPLTIANDYQLYVKGLSAYVSKKLKENGRPEKTVVVIDPVSDSLGKYGLDSINTEKGATSGWFRAYDNSTKTGLATRARGAECLENVTENLLTKYVGDESKCYGFTTDTDGGKYKSDGKGYIISEAVVKEADVIVLQGVQSNYGVMTKSEFEAYMKNNYKWTEKDLSSKIIIDSNPDCVYGLTCNSSETALGYGYYMGYVYPEYLDPVDAIAYFYKKCLHVTDEKSLQKFMDLNVAKAVANMKDNSTKLSSNWEAIIRDHINEGVDYFQNLDAQSQQRFVFVSGGTSVVGTAKTGIFTNFEEETNNSILYISTDLKAAKATLSSSTYTYTGKAIQPKVTVTVNGATISASNYTVTYKNNKNAGTATVTVTGNSSSKLYSSLSTSTTFKIKKASQNITVSKTNTSRTYKYSKLKKKAASFSINAKNAKGKLTYKVTKYPKKMKKYITVSSKGVVKMKKGAKKGTYKVTIKAASTTNYNAANKTITIKVK